MSHVRFRRQGFRKVCRRTPPRQGLPRLEVSPRPSGFPARAQVLVRSDRSVSPCTTASA